MSSEIKEITDYIKAAYLASRVNFGFSTANDPVLVTSITFLLLVNPSPNKRKNLIDGLLIEPVAIGLWSPIVDEEIQSYSIRIPTPKIELYEKAKKIIDSKSIYDIEREALDKYNQFYQ